MSRSPNKLSNGEMEHDLTQWDLGGAAVYLPSDGNTFLGCASLPSAGSYIEQSFTVNSARSFTVAYALKGGSGGSVDVQIRNHDDVVVWSTTETVTTAWQDFSATVGLPWGTYYLKFAFNDVAVYVDDVSVAHIIKTRLQLAVIIHERLGVLASNANIVNPETSLEDYNEAIDAGLRTINAIWHGVPDIRCVDETNVDSALDQIELAMLHRLHRYWSTKTDYSLGPRSESISQVTAAIDRLIGTAVGGRSAQSGRSIKTRRLYHTGY